MESYFLRYCVNILLLDGKSCDEVNNLMSNRHWPTARKLQTMVLIGIIISLLSLLVSILSLFISIRSVHISGNLFKTSLIPSRTSLAVSRSTVTPAASSLRNVHIIGGFSASTPDAIVNASDNGIKDIFYYGNPPAKNSMQGLMLQALHMQMIDGFIASNFHYYECQRGRAMLLPPFGLNSYCGQESYPTFANEADFLAKIAAHLQLVADNGLVIGYWALDDWASWDPGGARPLLIKVHQLIQKYTPGRPAICGFGGALTVDQSSGWSDWLADNFSPQGCDEVAFYIYATSAPATMSSSSPVTYDWSMSAVLSAMFVSLKQRGWNIANEPLIGIGQAFGGPTVYTGEYQGMITAQDIVKQSLSFCEHGAMGLAFYAWSDSGFRPETQTSLSSSVVGSGIQGGIAACNQYWNSHPEAGS